MRLMAWKGGHYKAVGDIHGFVESTRFYMHTDSYACFQLFMSGLNQAIFVGDHVVYHADHDRSGRASRAEHIDMASHMRNFSDMCHKEIPAKINGECWGNPQSFLPSKYLDS